MFEAERCFRTGQIRRAEEILRQIVQRDPAVSKAYELLAYICGNRGRFDECQQLLLRACELPGCSAEALFYLGKAHLQRGEAREAAQCIKRSVDLAGEHFELLHELGVAYAHLDDHKLALDAFQRAELKNGRSPVLLFNLGNSLCGLQRYRDALRYYERALDLDAQLAGAWASRGNTLTATGRGAQALESYARALALKPDDATTWMDQALTLMSLRRHADALASFEEVARLAPDTDYLRGYVLQMRMHVCQWEHWELLAQDLIDRVDAGERAAVPFSLMAIPAPRSTLLRSARTFAQDHCPAHGGASFERPEADRRIRVAYVSADFCNHATAQLMVRLFECHDRSRFEWFAFSLGTSADQMTERVASAFDHFTDVSDRTDEEVAMLMRSQGIDIAIDLHGFTQGYRTNIFARRAAPVQVNFLGFPGTMGCEYIDYIIADPTLVTPDDYADYAEKVVLMPDSYQPNDNTKAIGSPAPSRESLGLAPGAFVFACFNSNYKITPDVFDVWMRLLVSVPHGILWLLKGNEQAKASLEAQARLRGVDPSRIVWAQPMALPQHLARHVHADLFLDTFHYGAHTTCSDALWAGLPVLTMAGPTFASRVCASLLNAVGLPELVTHGVSEYEEAAKALAASPHRLSELRHRLQPRTDRCDLPLFDTPRFARHIEAAYVAMADRWRRGLPPDHITVSDSAGT
ncbi:MAG: tetratricopeptide repeat protein [Pseudomonadota bacterium]